MQMPNGQMIVRAASPPAAPLVSSREPRGHAPRSERAPRRELPDLFRFPSLRSAPSEADAPSPSPPATPNRAPARGHGHEPRQGPADFQHQRVHGGGGLHPNHPGTSPRRTLSPQIRPPKARRPFDFVFPLTTHRPIAQGPRGLDKLVHDDKGVTTISNDGATIMKVRDETRSPRGVGTADDARNETRRSANTSPRRSRPVCQPRERKRARAKIASRPFSRKNKDALVSFRLRLSD